MNIGTVEKVHMTIQPEKHTTTQPDEHMTIQPEESIADQVIEVSTNSDKSSGRPKKKRGFKGTPVKSKPFVNQTCTQLLNDKDMSVNIDLVKKDNFKSPETSKKIEELSRPTKDFDGTVDFNVTPTDTHIIPLGFFNRGKNVSFFNSVVQVLYSIPAFNSYVHELPQTDQYVMTIKEMLIEIANSNRPIKTSKYVRDLGLSNYIFGSQYDAHECLLQILDKIYPSVTGDCLVKISMLESTVCQNNNCQHQVEKSMDVIDLELNIFPSETIQNVTNLLSQPQIPSPLEGYRCDGCQVV